MLAWPALFFQYLFDDYDFLGRAQVFRFGQLLPDPQALFWRPVAREAYFRLLYLVAPNQPLIAHVLSALLLALAAALVAALGARLAGARAGFFAGAAFASLGAAPALVGWVSCDQDLFAIVFALVAIHLELSGRTALALPAMLLALLSKETAVALVPSIALVRAITGRAPARSVLPRLALCGLLVAVWAAVHPGIRGLVTHRFQSSDPAMVLSAARADLFGSITKIAATLVNLPLPGVNVEWPVELDMVLPFAMGALALGAFVAGPTGTREEGGTTGRVLLLAALLTLPTIVVVAALVKVLTTYYAVLAGIGTSLAIGVALGRLPRAVGAVVMAAFLAMGIYCRGMDPGPSVPTERTLKPPSERLEKLERGFRRVMPRIEGPTRLLVSLPMLEDRDVALHLIRLQVPRIWYRNPGIDVMYPERRTEGAVPERLAWVSPDLEVHTVDPATLAVESSGAPDSAGYRTALRGYARGVAASGDADRAVDLLLRMRTGDEWEQAYNRRLAGAILYASGRKADADRLLERTPTFNRNDAIVVAFEVVSVPSRLDLDAPILEAVGLDANDPETVRSILRQLALNRYPAATIRFAHRLLALRPGDPEAQTVLRMLERGADEEHVILPVEHDIPW